MQAEILEQRGDQPLHKVSDCNASSLQKKVRAFYCLDNIEIKCVEIRYNIEEKEENKLKESPQTHHRTGILELVNL